MLQILRQKAEEKNPDEFYFAMEKARTKNGVHLAGQIEANRYTQEQIKLMKTQDVGYLTLKSQAEKTKVERLRQNLHLLGSAAPPERRHIVFVENDQEAETFDPAKHFDTPAELLDRSFNRPRNEQLKSSIIVSNLGSDSIEKATKRTAKSRSIAYKELEQRERREKTLQQTASHLEVQKRNMSKGRRIKIKANPGSGSTHQYRWKSERKR